MCCSKYIIPNIFTGSKKKVKSVSARSHLIVTKVLSQDLNTESAQRILLHCIGAGVVYLPRQEANGGEEVDQCFLVPVTDETVTEID